MMYWSHPVDTSMFEWMYIPQIASTHPLRRTTSGEANNTSGRNSTV
jgi:hypothetical protein